MSVQYLERSGQPDLAYVYSRPSSAGQERPHVMFLGGYRSDMAGTKALYLEDACRARGQGFVRFDYSGHGQSDGMFEEGTIGSWMGDALDIFDHVIGGAPTILVGSSMGGWIALLVALRRAGLIAGLVGIAAAPDFTEEIYGRLDDDLKRALAEDGVAYVPNDYSDEPYAFTKDFYEEAKAHLLLGQQRKIDFPLRLLQGGRDKDVPVSVALKIQDSFQSDQSDLILVDDGDHRLSRPEDLALIDAEVKAIRFT